MSSLSSYYDAVLLRKLQTSGVTLEDIARAWASMDHKRDEFDAEKDVPAIDVVDGTYLGYICETEEILRRAISYAMERKVNP